MNNYHSEIIEQMKAENKLKENLSQTLNKVNQEHEEEITARKTAIELNNELLTINADYINKATDLLNRYSEVEPNHQ